MVVALVQPNVVGASVNVVSLFLKVTTITNVFADAETVRFVVSRRCSAGAGDRRSVRQFIIHEGNLRAGGRGQQKQSNAAKQRQNNADGTGKGCFHVD